MRVFTRDSMTTSSNVIVKRLSLTSMAVKEYIVGLCLVELQKLGYLIRTFTENFMKSRYFRQQKAVQDPRETVHDNK